MIITRTPFRVPLGGGGTDLPGFYKKHGGFIFSVTINKYMYVAVNRPELDNFIRVKYFLSETVTNLDQLKHDQAREALRYLGVHDSIDVCSISDIPSGTGMGSSLSYLVGLLQALHALNRSGASMQQLAEEASHIEMEILKSPAGKQDQYLAAFGGFAELNIDTNGKVTVTKPKVSKDTVAELEYKTSYFFSNKFHNSNEILSEQNKKAVTEKQVEQAMLNIKDIGHQIKNSIEQGNLSEFGKLLDSHWQEKKKISTKMSDGELDAIYDLAKANGASGGKLMGSGGGGLFMFFTPNADNKKKLAVILEQRGLKELNCRFSFEGSKVLLNLYEQSNQQ